LNLAREYGDQADFSLHDELMTVGFSGCLPIWPESVAQIFEDQRRASDQPAVRATVREVSYRFRVNGSILVIGCPRTSRDWLAFVSADRFGSEFPLLARRRRRACS
jgi:hypothetical protein